MAQRNGSPKHEHAVIFGIEKVKLWSFKAA